ncbi:MAG: amidohydrolase family protein, partial [Clostridia bacterium]
MDLRDKVLGGLPLDDFRIIDNHDHIGKWHAFYVPGGGGIDQMVASMDAVGIDQVFVTAHASIGPDFAFGNDIVADAIARYPERVFGYVTVNPNYPDMKGELQKRFANKGFRGIKLHPDCHSRAIDYAGYAPAYEWADEHRLPVLIHVWGPGEVAQVAHLSAEY